jgi:protein transport protein SEC24
MRVYRSLGVNGIMTLLYPTMLAIHDLAADVGFLGTSGRLKLPAFMRASYAYMVAEGAYLLCKSLLFGTHSGWRIANGETVMIWFGGAVSPQILDDLYGVDVPEELDVRMTRLPKLPTLLSTQIRNILTHLERLTGHTLPLIIVRQNMDGMEIEFANQLVEDSNNDALSYTDCEFIFVVTGFELMSRSDDGSQVDYERAKRVGR